MLLNNFLNEFDFEGELLDNEKYFHLVDLQKANLGNIELELFEVNNSDWKIQVIERLDTYINDYIIDSLIDILEEEHIIIDEDKYNSLEDIVQYFINNNIDVPDKEIIEVILNPDLLELGILDKADKILSDELLENY